MINQVIDCHVNHRTNTTKLQRVSFSRIQKAAQTLSLTEAQKAAKIQCVRIKYFKTLLLFKPCAGALDQPVEVHGWSN